MSLKSFFKPEKVSVNSKSSSPGHATLHTVGLPGGRTILQNAYRKCCCQDLLLIQRTNEELSEVDRLFKQAEWEGPRRSQLPVCAFLFEPPQAAAGLELHYQAESKGVAPTPPGLLPKQHVQDEVKRLAGLRLQLAKRIRVARCRGGGPAVIPDTELHPLARGTPTMRTQPVLRSPRSAHCPAVLASQLHSAGHVQRGEGVPSLPSKRKTLRL